MLLRYCQAIIFMASVEKPTAKDYDGKVTQEQVDKLEEKRIKYAKAFEDGSADFDDAREDYQSYAASLLIDLSGKLSPIDTQVPPAEPPKPTEGTVKEGGNQDADTWKIVSMKDDPTKFKVVDGNGKNIATDFSSQVTAQGYIDYYVYQKHNAQPPPPPTDGQPTGDVDQFGIRCIKKSSIANRVFTDFKLEEKMRNYQSGKPSEWSTEYTCDTKEILQNVEVTVYEKINGFKKEADTISLKTCGPSHHDGARFWAIGDFATDGSPKRTMEIEDPHPNNHSVDPKPLTEIGGSIIGKWIGYKVITFVAEAKRHFETWIHFPVENIDSPEQDKWRQYINYDITEKKYLVATGSLITSRLDGVKKGDAPDFKYASAREVIA
jgi:hypothetical protein